WRRTASRNLPGDASSPSTTRTATPGPCRSCLTTARAADRAHDPLSSLTSREYRFLVGRCALSTSRARPRRQRGDAHGRSGDHGPAGADDPGGNAAGAPRAAGAASGARRVRTVAGVRARAARGAATSRDRAAAVPAGDAVLGEPHHIAALDPARLPL